MNTTTASATGNSPKANKQSWMYSIVKTRWIWDAILMVSFIFVAVPQTTGEFLHEWGAVVFTIPFIIHLMLHWDWLKNLPKTLFMKMKASDKFNQILNIVIYFTMIMCVVSGIMISEELMPSLGFSDDAQDVWKFLHHSSSEYLFPLLGIHLAMHWDWIKKATKKMFAK